MLEFARPPAAIQVLLLLMILPAAFFDLRSRRIPNWLTGPAVLAAIALNVFLYRAAGLRIALAGLGLALLIYLPLYMIHAMGAGDVKLMAAIGAAVGPGNWVLIFVLTSLMGGAAAIVVVLSRGRFRNTLRNVWLVIVSLVHLQAPYRENPQLDVRGDQGIRLPHAVVIACGTTAFLAATAFISSFFSGAAASFR